MASSDSNSTPASIPSPQRALIIAYAFPPRGGGGVQRTLRFVRHLEEFGWLPTVVTPYWNGITTMDLCSQATIPASVKIVHAGVASDAKNPMWRAIGALPIAWRWEPVLRQTIEFPDYAAKWHKAAMKQCRRILNQDTHQVIYTTSPPVSSHMIGLELKRHFHIPWVADFRDPFSTELAYNNNLCSWRRRQSDKMQETIYAQADRVIANTPQNSRVLQSKHAVPAQRIVTITNGYDEEEFRDIHAQPPQDVFRITYCGSAYGNYHPGTFLAVMDQLLLRNPDLKIELTFAGTVSNWVRQHICDSVSKRLLDLRDYVPHTEVPALLASSHLLLQFLPPGIAYCVPGKLYEYLRSGTPILAIGDVPSELDRVLHETGRGRCYPHSEVGPIADYIQLVYDRWKTGATIVHPLNAAVTQYDGRALTGQLARTFDDIIMQKCQIVVPAERC